MFISRDAFGKVEFSGLNDPLDLFGPGLPYGSHKFAAQDPPALALNDVGIRRVRDHDNLDIGVLLDSVRAPSLSVNLRIAVGVDPDIVSTGRQALTEYCPFS